MTRRASMPSRLTSSTAFLIPLRRTARVGWRKKASSRKIEVVGDGRQAGFGDDLRQRQAEGDVEGDGQRIFRNQEVDVEFVEEIV